jgi:hypothetical protein
MLPRVRRKLRNLRATLRSTEAPVKSDFNGGYWGVLGIETGW